MIFKAENENVKVTGRSVYRGGVRYLGYSGSGVSFRFNGKRAVAHIVSDADSYPETEHAWIGIFINDADEPWKRIEISQNDAEYIIYDSDTASDVTVSIVKYTEPEFSVCGIVSLETDSEELLPPPEHRSRKIEMIGDSITCGYGIEGSLDIMELHSSEENPWHSYSLLTAHDLDAEASICAWNGKGVISGYIGEDADVPDDSWLIPDIYEYTDAGLEKYYFNSPKSEWEKYDFSSFEPDLVTVFLGTNDASYTRNIESRNEEFIEGYVKFLDMIRKHRPDTPILCMIGTMDQRLVPSVKKAVQIFNSDTETGKRSKKTPAYFLHLPLQDEKDGYGTFWHPTPVTHRKTADLVEKKIREILGW